MTLYRPLAAFGVTYFLTLLIAAYMPLTVLLLPAAIFVVAFLIQRFRRRSAACWLLFLAALLLAVAVRCVSYELRVRPVLKYVGQKGQATATVLETSAGYSSGYSSAILQIKEWNGNKVSFKAACDALPKSQVGDLIRIDLTLQEPGSDDLQASYAEGVFLSALYDGGYKWQGESKSIAVVFSRMRDELSTRLRRYLANEVGGVAAAMIVGDKQYLMGSTTNTVRRAGLAHLLVVSGLHLTMFCGFFWKSGTGRQTYYKFRAVFCMGLAVFLMALTGFTPSVCRAGIASIIFFYACYRMLPPDNMTAFAAAALLMCTWNCYAVCDVGLQLSFAASMGTGWAGILFSEEQWWLDNYLADNNISAKRELWSRRILKHIVGPFQSTFLASVLVLPVLLMRQMAAGCAGLLSNLLVMWLIAPILALGFAVMAVSFFPPLLFLYKGLSLLLALSIRLLLTAAEFCSKLPLSQIYLPPEFSCMVIAVLAVLIWCAYMRRRFNWLIVSVPVCIVLGFALGSAFTKDCVEITLVGNRANPCVVAIENGEAAVLFRGGQANAAAVERYLSRHAIAHAEWVIDIRREPDEVYPSTEAYICMENDEAKVQEIFSSLTVQMLHQKQGNLAVFEVDGWQFGAAAGSPVLDSDTKLDYFAAGLTVPDGLQCAQVLTGTLRFKKETLPLEAQLWYGSNEPSLWIRPGGAIKRIRCDEYGFE